MFKFFQILISLVAITLLSACAPKINPIDALPETTWQAFYVKGSKNLKKPDDAHIHFDENLELKIFGGNCPVNASVNLTRKKFKRCQCNLKIELKPLVLDCLTDKQKEKDFSEFQNLFIKNIASADTIRLDANRLEFIKDKKIVVELKRIPTPMRKH